MADRYQSFTQSAPGAFLSRRLGLPQPTVLRRHVQDAPLVHGPVRVGAAAGGRLSDAIAGVLDTDAVPVEDAEDTPTSTQQRQYGALVFDATGISSSEHLRGVYDFFHPVMRQMLSSGRVIVLGTPPEQADSVDQAVAQRALEGFVRTVGKELRGGSTAQLVYVAPGAEQRIGSTLRFLLSGRSAYVSGQVVRIGTGGSDLRQVDLPDTAGTGRPLDGRVVLVTGAARGIGAATTEVLARDGAHVICLDLPGDGEQLAQVAARVGGTSFGLDITTDDAPETLVDHIRTRHGRLDAVVHNAGITRDKTLAKMAPELWDQALAVNLRAPERLTRAMVDGEVLGRGSSVVGFSSIAGIAGNFGQTNYATSKAGVIGFVEFWAPRLAERGITVNAVAPGFIDTRMTDAMPFFTREVGRRMNSMQQAGLPIDVAETVGWLVDPGSSDVTGNLVRVCGQSLLGA